MHARSPKHGTIDTIQSTMAPDVPPPRGKGIRQSTSKRDRTSTSWPFRTVPQRYSILTGGFTRAIVFAADRRFHPSFARTLQLDAMAGLTFLTFAAAWEHVLQDAQVNKFSLANVDSALCVVGAGVQVVNGVVGCGTLIVCQDKTNVQGAYAAIQLHPPHAHVKGAGARLWHFHVRNVKLKENRRADDVENVFVIYEKGDDEGEVY